LEIFEIYLRLFVGVPGTGFMMKFYCEIAFLMVFLGDCKLY
jgi:hypothetical protein